MNRRIERRREIKHRWKYGTGEKEVYMYHYKGEKGFEGKLNESC